MHARNCFLTLTYDEEHLPENLSTDVEHWKLFAKRVRKAMGSFRFLHCGEYGEEKLRPHYHALLFGIDFAEDRIKYKVENGHQLWESKKLDDLWGMGRCTIGALSFDSAAYVARYALKKVTGPKAEEDGTYERVDARTGLVWQVKPEYITMSRRPGIGANWIKKFRSDVYPDDFIVMKGQKFRPPKFYDDRERELDEVGFEKILVRRREVAFREFSGPAPPERLAVLEAVTKARLKEGKKRG